MYQNISACLKLNRPQLATVYCYDHFSEHFFDQTSSLLFNFHVNKLVKIGVSDPTDVVPHTKLFTLNFRLISDKQAISTSK